MSSPDTQGGGPIESLVRLITQRNMQILMEESPGTMVMQEADRVFVYTLDSITRIVPSFAQMDFSSFLTYGYFIDAHRLMVAAMTALAFCFGLAILGYFCLKTRELAG